MTTEWIVKRTQKFDKGTFMKPFITENEYGVILKPENLEKGKKEKVDIFLTDTTFKVQGKMFRLAIAKRSKQNINPLMDAMLKAGLIDQKGTILKR